MDLKEIKKIGLWARRSGVKTIEINGLKLEFKDDLIARAPRGGKLKAPRDPGLVSVPTSEEPVTLDKINEYIYGNHEDVG